MKLSAFDIATIGGLLTVAVIEALNEAWKTEAHVSPSLLPLFHYAPLAILVVLGLLWIGRSIWSFRPRLPHLTNPSFHFPTPNWHDPLTPIVNRTFRNETVELDGKNFVDCSFENVTFLYNGTTPTGFSNCKIKTGNRQYD